MSEEKKINLNKTKNELIGIFDENNNFIRNAYRVEMRSKNLIHRCTDIVVLNNKNEILVQTRSLEKEYCPGYLDAVIGGVVGADEDPLLSANREIGEEIGIDTDNNKDKLKFVGKYFFEEDICKCWVYQFYIHLDDEEVKKINFRDNEVSSIKWYSKKDLFDLFNDNKTKITLGSKQTVINLSNLNLI